MLVGKVAAVGVLALGQFDAVARVTGYAAVLDRRTQDLPQQTERVLDRRHPDAVGDQLRHVRPARAPGAAWRTTANPPWSQVSGQSDRGVPQ